MSVSQISVFLESQPGRLQRVLDAFERAQVNVRGFSASDTGEYGVVRFVLDDPKRGLAVLQELGSAATTTEVVCLKLLDKPGELARVMGSIAEVDINVVYSYSLISTYIVLYVDDVERAEALLASHPVEILTQDDLV